MKKEWKGINQDTTVAWEVAAGNCRFTVFLCVLVCSDGFSVPISSGSLGKLHGQLEQKLVHRLLVTLVMI
jgi:hypothetical protein